MTDTNRGIPGLREIFEKEYTWIAGFKRNVYRYADKDAMIYPLTGEKWTYDELNRVVNRYANKLLSDGIKKGDVIMYQLLNCPQFAFTYVASHKIGTVNCPINYRLSSGEIAMNLDDSKPEVFLFEASQMKVIRQALYIARHRPLITLMVDIDGTTKTPSWATRFEDYISDSPDSEPQIDFEYNMYDETTRLYTSGTTGRQKGVPISSVNEVLSAHDVAMQFPADYRDVTINTTPWFHRGGLHCAGPAPMFYVGGTVVIMRKFDADECLDYVEKYGLTYIVGVPAVLEMLTKVQETKPRNISSLRGIVTMGSPLERAACIKYQQVLTPNIFNGYGLTETFWNTFLRPFELPDMAGTAGHSCIDDEVRVVKSYPDRRAEPDDTAAMDGTEIGEIIIRSAAKSSYCYFDNADETEKRFYKNFAYTGDLGTWDKNHFVTVVGRKDDMIISAGENIYPVQVEELLSSHEKVEDCIVTASPDKARGELVTAYIVPGDDTLTFEELDKFCKDSPMLANYKRPRLYAFIDEIPRNATGKKLHNKAKEMAAADLAAGKLTRI